MPHLEALLLLRAAEPAFTTAATLAQRLYVSDKVAQSLLADLCGSNMSEQQTEADGSASYRYQPGSDALRTTINDLADLYARRLVDVTHLIHSRLDRKAQQFADAFKWRKDS